MKESKAKGKKMIIFGLAAIILAVISGVAALAAGALKKETWQKANESMRAKAGLYAVPKEVSFSLAADNLKKLDISDSDDIITLSYGEVEQISVGYFADYEGQEIVTLEDGGATLKIKRITKWYQHIGIWYWPFDNDYRKVNVVLPLGTAFESSSIKISGGLLNAQAIDLGNVDSIRLSGGKAELNGCSADSISEIHISGGNLKIQNGAIENVSKITLSGGDIVVDGIYSSVQLNLKLSGGDTYIKNSIFSGGIDCGLSGGDVEFMNCIVEKFFSGKNSGGTVKFSGGSVLCNVSYSLSGGSLTLSGLDEAGPSDGSAFVLDFTNISGGNVQVKGLPHNANDIAFSLRMSGGKVTLNGSRIQEGSSGSTAPTCSVKAKLSGGSISIETK